MTLRAASDALEGRRAEALAGFRDAMARNRGHELRLAQMLLGIDVAATLGADEPDAAALVDEARAVMTDLRAQALLDRLEAAPAEERPLQHRFRFPEPNRRRLPPPSRMPPATETPRRDAVGWDTAR